MEVGDEVDLLIARQGELMTLRMKVAASPRTNWRFGFSSSRSSDQEDRVNEWFAPIEPVEEEEKKPEVEVFDI